MRKALLLNLLLLCWIDLYAQKGRTFEVEKLSPPKTKMFEALSYQQILEELIVKDRQKPDEWSKKQKIEGEPNIIAKSDIKGALVSRGFHPFFEGVYAAYADHHPFTLSPDMIWLLISQGFAAHVNNNVERLRSKFAKFDTKQTLSYQSDKDLNSEQDWGKAIAGLSAQIGQFAGPELTRTMTADFTTTTASTKIASQITLMNTVQAYFNYDVVIRSCGIPKITLEGTPKDWERLLAKTEMLRQYELDWWIDALEPVLKQFIQASKGKIDKQFWLDMFQHHIESRGCGPKLDLVDGWIIKFFPYDIRGERMDFKHLQLNGGGLPNEMLKVDLDYVDASNPQNPIHTPLELWAGFVGLEQDPKTFGLKPKIGWMIRKRDPYRQYLIDQLSAFNKNNDEVNLHVDNVPPELLKIGPINNLRINFFGNIRIPEELTTVPIKNMTLLGKTTEADVNRIVKLFPETKLHINGVNYN
ncbi:DUF4419 domain-containing protein [Mucilaginibacter ximonensis]|uniref:DUF4419 domain-containing protein n=1 Tax=Mucilaginibacter ximonensis TaxID=538021 RepID=A0ABW5YES5_9SPHI